MEAAFHDKEFSNWKKARESFCGHLKSECHKVAIEAQNRTTDTDVRFLYFKSHVSDQNNRKSPVSCATGLSYARRHGR